MDAAWKYVPSGRTTGPIYSRPLAAPARSPASVVFLL